MATLILTAVGTAVGGPIGGAVGAIVGQQIDSRLFAPKPRQGPRLGELAVQTSSYGTPVPKIFGTMRVAGTVIWATDLREQRATSGGGKGRPKTVEYSYSVSFAVALSGRRIAGVGRIWADGKLLRGAAGDFKSATGFRLYLGDEEQAVDPLIASAEGMGQAPAYRGTAYAVFEDFQLADYGNRIPSLSFEVTADAGPVSIGAIAEELSGGAIRSGDNPTLAGWAAGGDSVRGAIEALAGLTSLPLVEGEGGLQLGTPAGAPVTVAAGEAGAAAAGGGGRTEVVRRGADGVPGEVSIAYYDAARDYQTGLQRAHGGGGVRSERHALPAVLDAEGAKALAEERLAALWAGRLSAKASLGWRASEVRPGADIWLEGQAGRWRVSGWSLERMVVALELVRLPPSGLAEAPPASPGRQLGQPDLPHGATSLLLLDLPLQGSAAPDRPQLLAAAAGGEGWRRAELMASYDGGATWQAAGETAAPAVMGTALTALPAAGSALIDDRHRLEVELLNDAMWLEGRSEAALASGANLAVVGDELIQFGAAEPLGERRFRLSRLLRGRRGSEWAAEGHLPGEGFILVEVGSLAAIEPPLAALGGTAQLLASGVGDETAAAASVEVTGEAVRPPAPVHLRAQRPAGGDIEIGWVRRSRAGWDWIGERDTPLGEEQEAYTLRLSGAGFARALTLDQPAYLYTAAEQAADGFAGSLSIEVVQIGTSALSRPARLTID